jgi:hypothetical protein
MAFTAQGSRHGRTLLPRRPKDGQNRAITSGIWGCRFKVSDGWAPRPKNAECQMGAITAVLPLKAYGRRYIDDPGRCHILLTSLQSSVWTKAQFADWDPKYCFDRDTEGLFLIVQSSSTISFELICRRLNPHLPITRPVTVSLTHRLRSLWENTRTVMEVFLV